MQYHKLYRTSRKQNTQQTAAISTPGNLHIHPFSTIHLIMVITTAICCRDAQYQKNGKQSSMCSKSHTARLDLSGYSHVACPKPAYCSCSCSCSSSGSPSSSSSSSSSSPSAAMTSITPAGSRTSSCTGDCTSIASSAA